MLLDLTVLIKGAGEMATGVAWRLHNSHLKVLLTEVSDPKAVRRTVSFSEAVLQGSKTVEGAEAVLIGDPAQADQAWRKGKMPLLVDPDLECLGVINPQVLVEATLAKRNTGLHLGQAPLVIALGPGYVAGQDAHLVVETNRGHNLGRIYSQGPAESNTGVPGNIAGKAWERVLRAPQSGIFNTVFHLGDGVEVGQVVAQVDDDPVRAEIAGILRGLLSPGVEVKKGQKLGDIDPRGDPDYLSTISEKARALGGAVLEAILRVYNR